MVTRWKLSGLAKGTGLAFVVVFAFALAGPLASIAVAQDAATEEAAPAADEMPGMEADAPAEGDTAGAAGGAGDDPFSQAALPTVSDEELEAEVSLPPLGFLLEMFEKGGIFMWPLLICSLIGLAVILERFFTLSRAHINTRTLMSKLVGSLREQGPDGAIDVCRRTRGPIAAILHAGLMRAPKGPEAVEKAIESAGTIEMSFLQRGLIVLASVANVAPLLGFLGTVSGMINAFEAIAAAEQVSAKLVASGISEALITTATGLIIAIPVQIANNFFISRIDRFVLEMEEASVELVDTLVDMEMHEA